MWPGRPSVALYWHMGETMMRLGRVSGPRRKGENRWDAGFMSLILTKEVSVVLRAG